MERTYTREHSVALQNNISIYMAYTCAMVLDELENREIVNYFTGNEVEILCEAVNDIYYSVDNIYSLRLIICSVIDLFVVVKAKFDNEREVFNHIKKFYLN